MHQIARVKVTYEINSNSNIKIINKLETTAYSPAREYKVIQLLEIKFIHNSYPTSC